MTIQPTLETERELWARGYLVVAGVDEVGRGVWAGPVVAGAVVLPDDKLDSHWVRRLRDSKVLSARAREELATEIIEACDYGIGAVDEQGVDELGIVVATRQAMRLAVLELQVRPDALIIDGNEVVDLDIVQRPQVKADAHCQSVAAASIIAKVARDLYMVDLAKVCPGYGFEEHKGYGTKQHQQALDELGPCPAHRRSVRPVREALS